METGRHAQQPAGPQPLSVSSLAGCRRDYGSTSAASRRGCWMIHDGNLLKQAGGRCRGRGCGPPV
jgi:hypothetical protein